MRASAEHLYPIAVLLVLAGATIWLERSTREQESSVQSRLSDTPDYIAEGARLVSYDETGALHYELTATRIEHFPDTEVTLLDQPRLAIQEDAQHMLVSAREGEARRQGEEIFLRGRVALSRQSGGDAAELTLTGETLTIWPNDQRAHSDDPVVLTQGSSTAAGNSLQADNLFGTMTLDGAVRIRFQASARTPK